MAQYTQKAILGTFKQMLEEMPFDKITVSALVRRCEISSNTFYYHYSDIYDLLDVWIRNEITGYLSCEAPYDDWRASVKNFLHACREHPSIVYHIFNCVSINYFEGFMFTLNDDIFCNFVRSAAQDHDVPEEKIKEIADVCRYAFSGLFLRFLWGRMRENIDSVVDNYGSLVDDFVMDAVQNYPRKPIDFAVSVRMGAAQKMSVGARAVF